MIPHIYSITLFFSAIALLCDNNAIQNRKTQCPPPITVTMNVLALASIAIAAYLCRKKRRAQPQTDEQTLLFNTGRESFSTEENSPGLLAHHL